MSQELPIHDGDKLYELKSTLTAFYYWGKVIRKGDTYEDYKLLGYDIM